MVAGALIDRGNGLTEPSRLSAAGEHPYLVGESEARGVLDVVRAVRQRRPFTGWPDDRARSRLGYQ